MKQLHRLSLMLFVAMLSITANAQISGAVFKDFNGNGTKDANEPFAGGVVVKAYNTSDALVGTATTTAPLSGTTNYSITPPAYPVRLEFTIPSTGGTLCINPSFDYAGYAGATYGSNVRFVTGTTTTANFALNNPAEYVKTTNPYFYTVRHVWGNPLAGSGTSTTRPGIEATPYLANLGTPGATSPAQRTLAVSYTGSCYGLAYSKQAAKIFTSAYIKRHVGLGTLGSGGIYMVDTSLSTASVVNFYNMDANGYATRSNAAAGAPAYGSGTSYNIPVSAPTGIRISYIGSTDPVSGMPLGMGVIGTNAQRNLGSAASATSDDPAAYGQVGIFGLGDLDISDDGSALYTINLYDRKLYKLTLDNITNPTAISAVNSFTLPNPPLRNTLGGGYATTYAGDNSQFYDGTKGRLRPFALKFYRGKIYVGAVTTGEGTGAVSTTDNNAGNPEYTDLWAYVFEFDPATGTWSPSPVLQFPLNFNRSTDSDGYDETFELWKDTTMTTGFTWSGASNIRMFYAQAMFTDIEFDPADGSMIIGIRDRTGDQIGHFQNKLDNTAGEVATALGETLRAYRTSSCTFELESAGKEGPSSSKAATAGSANGQGPGGGEFYFRDNVYDASDATPNATFHVNVTEGALAVLPGTNEVMVTTMDPADVWQQGIDWFNNTTGVDNRNHAMELANSGNNSTGYAGKGAGLGDIELLNYSAPVELGNAVWNDANGDGIFEAGESGLANITISLYSGDLNGDGDLLDANENVLIAQTVTDANGNWYFNNTNVTDGDPSVAGNQTGVQPYFKYIIRVGDGEGANPADWDDVTATGLNQLAGFRLTITDKTGNGEADISDNDASLQSNRPSISFTTAAPGSNNHNLDLGFTALAQVGDKVWRDDDKDGSQDSGEPGVSGVTVTLFRPGFGPDGIAANSDDGNPVLTTLTDAYGNYLFNNLPAGTYQIQVTLPSNYQFSTQTNTVDNTDGTVVKASGSDVNATSGLSYSVVLSAGESEKNIDAGIIFNSPAAISSLGDKVWNDLNGDGIQNVNEPGLSGITVTLYNNLGVAVATTITDANGNYLFNNLTAGQYAVGVTLPAGFSNTIADQGGNDNTDSDVNPATGHTALVTVPAATAVTNVDIGLVQNAATTASIGDKVWNDVNQNGIQDAGEPGVAGVTVELRDATGTTVITTTVTDAFGNYIFTNLSAGTYTVNFILPVGYTFSNANAGSNDYTDSDPNPATGLTAQVVVPTNAGYTNMSVDAGIYQNAPAGTASLGDKVWLDNDEDGVLDAGEAGVPGITVTLYTNGFDGIPGNGDDVVVGTTVTDINGNYQFVNLAAGNYNVGFSNLPSGYSFSPSTGTSVASNSNSDPNQTTGRTGTITLAAGSVQTIDAGIYAGQGSGLGSIGNSVWYDVDADGIQDAGELGIQGITVTLKDPGPDGIAGNGDDITIAATATNSLGEYIFTGLNAGNYFVEFTVPGAYTVSAQNAGTDDTKDSDGAAPSGGISRTPVYSLAQGEDNLTIDLGMSIATRNTLGNLVWMDTDSDGVQDAGEAGVPGITVTLYNDGADNTAGTGDDQIVSISTTNIDGNYLFTGLVNDGYYVKFSNLPAGYNLSLKDNDGTAGNGTTDSDADRTTGITSSVSLTGGTNNTTLDAGIINTRSALGSFVWEDLDGDGIQDAGEPGVAGVTVSLFYDANNDGDFADAGENVPAASMITNQNGAYFFPNLNPGNYQVQFGTLPTGLSFTQLNTPGDNGNGSNSDASQATGTSATINLAAGETDLTIDAGLRSGTASIGNFVFFDEDIDNLQGANETGVAGVIINLYNVGPDGVYGNADDIGVISTTITNSSGFYQFTNVYPGNYVLQFVSPGGSLVFVAGDQGADDAVDSDVNSGTGQTNAAITVTNGTSNITIDAGIRISAIVPISLSFTAQKYNSSSSLLKWTIYNSTNAAYLVLERSLNGTSFTQIARNNNTSAGNYEYTDQQPARGNNYYRLRMVNANGSFSYSPVRILNFGSNGLQVYPNPVKNNIFISMPDSWVNKTISVSMVNSLGQTIYNSRFTSAQQTEVLNAEGLPNGNYVLVITNTDDNSREFHKIQIIK